MDQKQTENKLFQTRPFFKKPVSATLSAVALALASVELAFADSYYAAVPAAILLFAYVVLMSRRISAIVLAGLILGIPLFVVGDLLAGAFFLSLYVAIAAGASLIFLCRTPAFSLLSSALALGVCALISGGQLVRILPAVFVLPAYLLLSLAHMREERRSIEVLAAQSGLVLVALGLAATYLFQTYGALNREIILSAMESLRAGLLEFLQAFRQGLIEGFNEAKIEIPSAIQQLMTDDVLTEFVRTLSLILPGLVAAFCGLAAFCGQSLFLAIRQNEDDKKAKTAEAILFSLGIPSAVVYFVSLVLMFFLDGSSLPYAVCQNLSIILLLPFGFAGFQRLLALLLFSPKGGRWFLLLLFCSICCCLSVGVVELLALYAAVDTIFSPFRKKILARKNGSDRQDGDDNQ